MKVKNFNLKLFALAMLVYSFITQTFAEGNSDFPPNYYDIIALVLLAIVILTFGGLIYFEEKKDVQPRKSVLLTKVRQFLTRSVPVEKEEEILFDHEFDGIRELDNRIPPWYNYLFYITIVFGIYYLLHYHVFATGKLMYEEYEEEVRIAEMKRAELMDTGTLLNEDNVTLLTDASELTAGKSIFDLNCVACHQADGGGLVGPNLTDQYWIHGGGIKNVFKVVKNGVPEKGMISWQTQLNPKQIQQVASYVLSLQGTAPAAPKAPEGNIWEEPEQSSETEEKNI